MAQVVIELLWLKRAEWLPARQGKLLGAEVGRGQATYFKPGLKADVIVFGRKMVASKCSQFAQQWLSYRELKRFHYFDGEVSPLNLLAHTVCHEFAHYLQAHFKQRRRGEVHNAAFYQYLDDIYQRGYAAEVKQALAKLHPELTGIAAITAADTEAQPAKPLLAVGDTVRFNNRGKVTEGVVLRLNRKTVSVGSTATRHAYWRVPFHLLA